MSEGKKNQNISINPDVLSSADIKTWYEYNFGETDVPEQMEKMYKYYKALEYLAAHKVQLQFKQS